MPVISFANPKGGAGKTTTALLLATELAAEGATVTIV
ncbi:MAG: AAA family ATPase, partial [Pseudomonadota bacterium]